jgi:hypothetical protein
MGNPGGATAKWQHVGRTPVPRPARVRACSSRQFLSQLIPRWQRAITAEMGGAKIPGSSGQESNPIPMGRKIRLEFIISIITIIGAILGAGAVIIQSRSDVQRLEEDFKTLQKSTDDAKGDTKGRLDELGKNVNRLQDKADLLTSQTGDAARSLAEAKERYDQSAKLIDNFALQF